MLFLCNLEKSSINVYHKKKPIKTRKLLKLAIFNICNFRNGFSWVISKAFLSEFEKCLNMKLNDVLMKFLWKSQVISVVKLQVTSYIFWYSSVKLPNKQGRIDSVILLITLPAYLSASSLSQSFYACMALLLFYIDLFMDQKLHETKSLCCRYGTLFNVTHP